MSSTLVTPSTNLTVSTAGTIQFRVRAVDVAANVGDWTMSSVISPRLVQNTSSAIAYRKTWTKHSLAAFSAGSAKYSKVAGAYATVVSTGTSFSFVTTKASNRGWARIYVNGKLVARVNLKSATTKYRVLAWRATWATAGPRTIKVYVEGTAGRPRVDLDAFASLSSACSQDAGPRYAGPRRRHVRVLRGA